MLIKPFRKYIVLCTGNDQKAYRWYLKVEPDFNAWKVVNQNIRVGEVFKDHLILSIEDVTNTSYEKKSTMENELKFIEDEEKLEDDFNFWEKPISKDEFDLAVNTSSIGFAVRPSYSQIYRCQICGGVVANDICTECMFDWDC